MLYANGVKTGSEHYSAAEICAILIKGQAAEHPLVEGLHLCRREAI